MRPTLNALGGPGRPVMNTGPGGTDLGQIQQMSIQYPTPQPLPPGGRGPQETPIMTGSADSANCGDNIYILTNVVPSGPNRPNFPMGPGVGWPMGVLGGIELHHMNGPLGSKIWTVFPRIHSIT